MIICCGSMAAGSLSISVLYQHDLLTELKLWVATFVSLAGMVGLSVVAALAIITDKSRTARAK